MSFDFVPLYVVCPLLKPPFEMSYHKAQIAAGIFNSFFNFQNPFPDAKESSIFPGSAGLQVNNHSSPSSECKSIVIDLASMGWQDSRCPCTERGGAQLASVEAWGTNPFLPSLMGKYNRNLDPCCLVW